MDSMTVAQLAKEIHQNAVEHGWYTPEPRLHSVLANIHDEISEAWEEYRRGKPMLYFYCEGDGEEHSNDEFGAPGCDTGDGKIDCKYCPFGKPEGIPVELADVVIRILDFSEHLQQDMSDYGETDRYNREVITEYNAYRLGIEPKAKAEILSYLVARLHDLTACAHQRMESGYDSKAPFATAIYLIELYLNAEGGYSLESLIRLKHAYNLTRPYRHGGLKA